MEFLKGQVFFSYSNSKHFSLCFLAHNQTYGLWPLLTPLLRSESFYLGRRNLSPLWPIIFSLQGLARTGKFHNTFFCINDHKFIFLLRTLHFVHSSLQNSIAIQVVEHLKSFFLHFVNFPNREWQKFTAGEIREKILCFPSPLQLFCSNWGTYPALLLALFLRLFQGLL